MSIALARRYTNSNKSKAVIAYDKIDATNKWIEYSLDEIELKKAFITASFNDKCIIMQALKVIERKLQYHYKHKNFCMSEATAQLKHARRLLKM
jgi:hemolysin activation/secretion protein